MPRVNTKRCDDCARHEFKQQGCSFWVPDGVLKLRSGCAIWLPSGCLDVGWEAERIMVQDDNEEGSRKNV